MFWRRPRSENDFREEIQAHIDLEAERWKDQGLNNKDALAAARKQFGSVLAAQERFHVGNHWFEHDPVAGTSDPRFAPPRSRTRAEAVLLGYCHCQAAWLTGLLLPSKVLLW